VPYYYYYFNDYDNYMNYYGVEDLFSIGKWETSTGEEFFYISVNINQT
jgi:hypothetical protein